MTNNTNTNDIIAQCDTCLTFLRREDLIIDTRGQFCNDCIYNGNADAKAEILDAHRRRGIANALNAARWAGIQINKRDLEVDLVGTSFVVWMKRAPIRGTLKWVNDEWVAQGVTPDGHHTITCGPSPLDAVCHYVTIHTLYDLF